jgi:protein involved in polysaccharide export with SLBB domain
MKTFILAAILAFCGTGVWAAPADFSDGLTGAAGVPVRAAGEADDAWHARQAEAEKAAKDALSAPAPKADVAPGQLAAGDKVRLTVFGEEDLSGEFEVDNTGSLSLPLMGEIKAQGLTPRELEKRITDKLNDGYLVNPRVSVAVMNFRPFFILGEVNKPGSYPWVNDMTVINAVALGGGYTPRAKTGEVRLRRNSESDDQEKWVPEDTKVYPGDVIRVDERFF